MPEELPEQFTSNAADPLTQLRNLLMPPEEVESKQELQELKRQLVTLQQQRPNHEGLTQELVPVVAEEVKRYLLRSPTTVAQWLTPVVKQAIEYNQREIAEKMVSLLPPRPSGLTQPMWDRLSEELLRIVEERVQQSDEQLTGRVKRILQENLANSLEGISTELVEMILPELVVPLQTQLKRAIKPYLEQQQQEIERHLQRQVTEWVTLQWRQWREELMAQWEPKGETTGALPSVEDLQPAIAAQVQHQLSQYVSTQAVPSPSPPNSSELVQSLTPTLESLIRQQVEQVQGELLSGVQLPESTPNLATLESSLIHKLEAVMEEKIQTALAQLPPLPEPVVLPTTAELMAAMIPAIEEWMAARMPSEAVKTPSLPQMLVFKEKAEGKGSGSVWGGWGQILVGVVLVALLPLGWMGYGWVRERRLSEQLTAQLEIVPQLSPYRLQATVQGDRVILAGQVPDHSLHQTMERVIEENAPDLAIDNQVETITPPPTPEQIQREITQIEATLDRLDGISISAQYQPERAEVKITGTVIQAADASKITQSFAEVPGVRAVTNTVKVQPPQITTRLYFGVNSAQLATTDLRVKLMPLVTLLKRYPELKLRIVGHIHPIQERQKGLTLSRQRGEAVQKMLIQQGIEAKRLRVEASAYPPVDVNPQQEDWLQRVVVFYPQ